MSTAARSRVAEGFAVLKVKAGTDAAADVDRVTADRRAVGPEARIRLDANQGCTPHEAVRVIRSPEDAGARPTWSTSSRRRAADPAPRAPSSNWHGPRARAPSSAAYRRARSAPAPRPAWQPSIRLRKRRGRAARRTGAGCLRPGRRSGPGSRYAPLSLPPHKPRLWSSDMN
ncbi:enolase C-terminal domain-like protein [Streptomyces sp. YKOK-I1]